MGFHFKLMLYIKTFSRFYLAIYLCIIGAILFIGIAREISGRRKGFSLQSFVI